MIDQPLIIDALGTEHYVNRPDADAFRAELQSEAADLIASGMSANEVGSVLVSRMLTAQRLGLQFGGARDMYRVLGYKTNLFNQDFINSYRRDHIMARIVNLPAKDTWRRHPVLVDGDERSDQQGVKSPFLKAWQMLVRKKRIIHYLQRVDRLARLGSYAVLLVGVRDGTKEKANPLSVPLTSKVGGPQGLLYLRPHHEDSAAIGQFDQDMGSENYGKPLIYNLQQIALSHAGQGFATGTVETHYSRVIHVAEDLLDNDVYGIPPLEKVMNLADDMMKTIGGSAEALWKEMRRGVAFVANTGNVAINPTQQGDVKEQLTEYDHGLRRVLTLGNVTPHVLGSGAVDPRGVWEVILDVLAAASDIPQRILIGSERGELASSQDMTAWSSIIEDRRINYAEPAILRPLVDLLVSVGILPQPTSGEYNVVWLPVYSLDEIKKAEKAEHLAQAIKHFIDATGAVDVVDPDEFREQVLDFQTEREPGQRRRMPDIDSRPETDDERDAFEQIQNMAQ